MAYRKFWLLNSNNERYDLTDEQGSVFLNQPDNLGFSKSYSSMRVGNSEIINNTQNDLNNITGELIFYKRGNNYIYQDYFDFVQFIRFQPLRLYYLTPNNVSPYYTEVVISSVGKGEIDYNDGCLHCPISYKRITLWLTSEVIQVKGENSASAGGKEYNLIRDYSYEGGSLANLSLNNEGSESTGMIIEIIGACNNPQFALFQNNVQYGICKLTGNFDYVRIDSIETEEEIYLESSGSILANPTAYQDLSVADGTSFVTFCKLATGVSTMVWNFGTPFTGEVLISYQNTYVSV